MSVTAASGREVESEIESNVARIGVIEALFGRRAGRVTTDDLGNYLVGVRLANWDEPAW